MMKIGTLVRAAMTAAVLCAAVATPADARRFRFGLGGSGRSEQIEPVADLPDRDPYRHDGAYWDLGWFYSSYKLAGITTSSSHDAGQFVLYHNRSYILLDAEKLALIREELGTDPTVAFRAKQAEIYATGRARAAADAESLKDNLIPRRPGESTAAYHARARTEAAKRSAARAPTEPAAGPTEQQPRGQQRRRSDPGPPARDRPARIRAGYACASRAKGGACAG